MIMKTWTSQVSLMVTRTVPVLPSIPALRQLWAIVLFIAHMVILAPKHEKRNRFVAKSLLHCIITGGSLKQSDGKCISVKELNQFHSKGSLAYSWDDLRPKGVDKLGDTDLVVLGDSGN